MLNSLYNFATVSLTVYLHHTTTRTVSKNVSTVLALCLQWIGTTYGENDPNTSGLALV